MCYNMHGDIMKKLIRIKYRNIFKYEDHQEVVKIDKNGYLEEFDDCKVISFVKDKPIKVEIKADEVVLHNGTSVLYLVLNKDVLNDYQTDYGTIPLKTRLIHYEAGNNIKIKYELYDGSNLISHVYMMISYTVLEN